MVTHVLLDRLGGVQDHYLLVPGTQVALKWSIDFNSNNNRKKMYVMTLGQCNCLIFFIAERNKNFIIMLIARIIPVVCITYLLQYFLHVMIDRTNSRDLAFYFCFLGFQGTVGYYYFWQWLYLDCTMTVPWRITTTFPNSKISEHMLKFSKCFDYCVKEKKY